jgi:deoxycytidylate deaminase
MTTETPSAPELVLGLVGPVGADLEKVIEELVNAYSKVNFEIEIIRMSQVIRTLIQEALGTKDIKDYLPESPEDLRIWAHMTAGNAIRKITGEDGVLAMAVLMALRKARLERSNLTPRLNIIRSLKSPEELRVFREVYGDNFVLVAAHASRDTRIRNLADRVARSRNEERADRHQKIAMDLVNKDEAETDPYYGEHGQHVSEVFPMADIFVRASDEVRLGQSLGRFVELFFGTQPFHTPSRDEFAMFHAQAASLRSSTRSRQVGAVIATDDGNVVAVGTNEAPKPKGGLYWSDEDSGLPDWKKGYDSSDKMRMVLLKDVLERLKQEGDWLSTDKQAKKTDDLVTQALPFMSEARLMDISEFGRNVHAEMAALLDAAKRGVSVGGLSLYCTTFPCHECAKHIIAAGIKRVVYIEPYPKSRAKELFEEAIVVDPTDSEATKGKVRFEPFVGIAPRQYMSLFAFAKDERRIPDGGPSSEPMTNSPVSPQFHPRYFEIAETVAAMEVTYASRLLRAQKKLESENTTLELNLREERERIEQQFDRY